MAEPFIGEIRAFGFNFAPPGWASCNGQLLPVSQWQALFSILGTAYGGDGETTFALPDLRGRVAMHSTTRPLGQRSGTETHALNISEIPSHTHSVRVGGAASEEEPEGRLLARASFRHTAPGATTDVTMASSLGAAGDGVPHENMQPSLVIHYCIAISGVFPGPS